MTARGPIRLCLLGVLAALLASFAPAVHSDPRPREIMSADQIRLALDKLDVVGTALYVGAHPDDENTALLAWLSKGRKVRTIYLSMTRGDGGQNLLGSDTGERLGVIRTQELLAARRVDGAEQRFTRAIDFGFSKGSDETLKMWGHDRTLEDVVWVIRRLHPDVIITRFPPDSTAGHGHHAASAILAAEAFRAAADTTKFREQLQWLRPWQAKRLMWNVFRFGSAGPDTTPGRISVDLGAYDPGLGQSYTEIAGQSRSMHKTQGFGAAERRGPFTNSFVFRDGTPPSTDLFDGVAMGWKRFEHGDYLEKIIVQARHDFDPVHPEAILPLLLRIQGILLVMGDEPIIAQKKAEALDLIRSCTGLWLEATAARATVTPGSRLRVITSALARTPNSLAIERVQVLNFGIEYGPIRAVGGIRDLVPNRAVNDTFDLELPKDLDSTQPYWLRRPPVGASFDLQDQRYTSAAENVPRLMVRFSVVSGVEHFDYDVPVVYRWVDPVAGERYRSVDVVPPATLSFARGSYLFPDTRAQWVDVTVHTTDAPVSGNVELDLPMGWTATPLRIPVSLRAGNADTLLRFKVTPAATPGAALMGAAVVTESEHRMDEQMIVLDYPHVPMQMLLPAAQARLVHTSLRTSGHEVGYVMGSGDQVPKSLEEMGFHVTLLDDDFIDHGDLSAYKVIVIGVRAYNTRPRLLAQKQRLLDWVSAGGRLVVQYQTPDDALTFGPRPLHVSRDRVTVEDAPVALLKPAHPLLNSPNKIGPEDFAGWVQERGLSFSDRWDPAYEALLSCHDPGEPARDGGLLVTRYGKGTFIYSGYAWFRQLPAGVPGAWRLFANLVSTGP